MAQAPRRSRLHRHERLELRRLGRNLLRRPAL